jgi:predicted aspartyl protease
MNPATIAAMVLLLLQSAPERDQEAADKVAQAVARAEQLGTAAAIREALDACYRADAWQDGERLAETVLAKHADDSALKGRAMRALWRAGRILEAERLADSVAPQARDREALPTLIAMQSARGRHKQAAELADRIEASGGETAEELAALIHVRLHQNRLGGLGPIVRAAERLSDPNLGYPNAHIQEGLEGFSEFLEKCGAEPLNQVVGHGRAPMGVLLVRLPYCDVMINGRGPYRMVVDTGGSITLSLDSGLAEELGLENLGEASIRGVGGKDVSGQSIVDELRIGEIVCRRVMTRTFAVRKALMHSADGILGTGIFAQHRMTLDFMNASLVVGPSSDPSASGDPAELRLIGDAKLFVLVTMEGKPAVAMLDSGADAVAMSPQSWRELFPDRELKVFATGAMGVGQGNATQVSLGPGVSVAIGERKFQKFGGIGLDVLDRMLSPILGVQMDLLLGMPVFRDMRSLTVDFPTARMWIDWLPVEAEP